MARYEWIELLQYGIKAIIEELGNVRDVSSSLLIVSNQELIRSTFQ